MADKPNRVWIELEYPKNAEEGHARAKLLNTMLKRLGVSFHSELVFWHEDKDRYCFTLDEAGGFVEAQDHGHWYNLDMLGKEQ